MKLSATTVNQVINRLVYFHASMGGGASSLAVQLDVLKNSADGVFGQRDDGDKSRSAFTAEDAVLARMDLLPLWKDLSDREREVLVLRNSPRRFDPYAETVPLHVTDPETGVLVDNRLPEDAHVVSEHREDGKLAGWNVMRLALRTWDWGDIAARMETTERDVKAMNRRAREKIRRAIERVWLRASA